MNKPRDFWSRRKAAVQAETEAEHAALEAQEIAQQQAELEDKTDAEILAELDLPDPDDLKPGDDVSGFMARAVPERIRQRALRRLWRLNPVLANVDAAPHGDPDAIRDALVRQLTHPVLWERSMQRLIDDGVSRFVEVGAGRVLRGLMRKIDRRAEVVNVAAPADLAAW